MMARLRNGMLYQIKLLNNCHIFTKQPGIGCRLGSKVEPYGSCNLSTHGRVGHL